MDTAFHHIAVCLDESPSAVRALSEARRLRTFGEGRLSILHVVQFPPPFSTGYGLQVDLSELMASAETWLAETTEDVTEGTALVLQGHPATEAARWAGDHAVDLLICAAHHNLAQRVALGSFAHNLVNHAPCPVLVLRSAPPDDA